MCSRPYARLLRRFVPPPSPSSPPSSHPAAPSQVPPMLAARARTPRRDGGAVQPLLARGYGAPLLGPERRGAQAVGRLRHDAAGRRRFRSPNVVRRRSVVHFFCLLLFVCSLAHLIFFLLFSPFRRRGRPRYAYGALSRRTWTARTSAARLRLLLHRRGEHSPPSPLTRSLPPSLPFRRSPAPSRPPHRVGRCARCLCRRSR